MAVAIAAVSTSAPLILYAAAPALAVSFWRNALASTVLVPAALAARRPWGRSAVLGSAAAGVALAVHFGTWMPSVRLTGATASTALVCTQPVWAALLARRHLPRLTWLGIGVAVAGTALATGADVTVSAHAVLGDLLALAGGVAGAVYVLVGERVRAGTSTAAYTAICYPVCAALLGALCLATGTPLAGFDGTTWLAIAAITAGPQLLGHTLVNFALHRVPATTVSVLLLLEVPGAALLAWVWLDQAPRAAALPGLVLLLGGVAITLRGQRGRRG